MSEKNPLPFAKTQSRYMLLLVLVVLIGLPLILPSATLATEILIFAMAALACNLLLRSSRSGCRRRSRPSG